MPPHVHRLVCVDCHMAFSLEHIGHVVASDGQMTLIPTEEAAQQATPPVTRPGNACGNCGHPVQRGVCTRCGSGQGGRDVSDRQEPVDDATAQRFSQLEME